MDRNSIIGIILIFIILVVWGIINQPKQEELARKRRIADSLARIKKQQERVLDTLPSDTIKKN